MSVVVGGPAQDLQSLVLSCNKDGMESLRKGQQKAAFEQFKFAEATLIAHQSEGGGEEKRLLAVTCNNLGCYYKKVGKLHGALSYLRRALNMEVDLGTDDVTVAGTHLNICAILSKLEKHDKAVQHALSALELISQRIEKTEPDKVAPDDYSVLAIAYHNVAVERDCLGQFDKAAAAFEKGFSIAQQHLGQDHPLALALQKNSDSMALKSAKASKARFDRKGFRDRMQVQGEGGETSPGTTLPALPGIDQRSLQEEQAGSSPMPVSRVRQEAEQWVTSDASKEWLSRSPKPHEEFQASPRMRSRALMLTDSEARELPSAPLGDIINADRTGHPVTNVHMPPNDFRPNRQMKGSTRTARVVRRTGLANCTKHRDEALTGGAKAKQMSQLREEYIRKMAAERIQRHWRAYYKYCRENEEWMVSTWKAATIIQTCWRSYHVRRIRLDKAATSIQRLGRGHIVRRSLKRHRAAVTIQRHVLGMIVRNRLRFLHSVVMKVNKCVRGFLGRRRAKKKRMFLTKTALTIQCGVRAMIAKRRVRELREARRVAEMREKSAVKIQKVHRGNAGRQYYAECRRKYERDLLEYQAASKLQAMARRDAAIKKVDLLRADKLQKMHEAATFVRKMWLGQRTRKKYKILLDEFAAHEKHIINMQRHARGFLVRLRMWRQAIRMEDELWAALEMQRVWRGYKGRVAFEEKYEQAWRREMSAVKIQRNLRGWLARAKVSRQRRKIARAEFERARLRFRSAQKLQALARGVLIRKVFAMDRAHKTWAVVQIQRLWRGYRLRKQLWEQVVTLRATMIQATARGFLVRNRRFHVMAKVIMIQRTFRRSTMRPESVIERARAERAERKEKAQLIQKNVRDHQQQTAIARHSAATASAADSKAADPAEPTPVPTVSAPEPAAASVPADPPAAPAADPAAPAAADTSPADAAPAGQAAADSAPAVSGDGTSAAPAAPAPDPSTNP
mmetsp:Transcript_78539/g.163178  ORF Transcript_78539/g.163178 Transcript_78539/m.163178 type:complete len:963 (+) Transcript_78539:119-3007(+)|eukprot:CAMPEP_0206435722 /NCGR_PEP_ID=MMETSP0324_2-20121206/10049_1 /ASSEMBLY_ACC=CAM_ASM_000836 /TAXON_ID=2866 /ORGANISM="Crypthecodinium cohnii, Strain Seligo" /LENGTH=962 /DNA_ID=CAMNT_0053902735 /DNA_START=103 /DNA_END=2991 /DNA_ORIENTATION=+